MTATAGVITAALLGVVVGQVTQNGISDETDVPPWFKAMVVPGIAAAGGGLLALAMSQHATDMGTPASRGRSALVAGVAGVVTGSILRSSEPWWRKSPRR